MGVFGSTERRTKVNPGDHIYTSRAYYTHHGIYVGFEQNLVIHFSNQTNSGSTSLISSSSSMSSIPSIHARGPSCASTPCPNYHKCGIRQPNSGVVLSCLDCFLKEGLVRIYEYGLSRSLPIGGTCATSDSPETVIHRATYLLQTGFGDYDLVKNNCEDFALYCKTGLCVSQGIGRSGQVALAGLFLGGQRDAKLDFATRGDVIKIEVEELAERMGWTWPDVIIVI